MKTPDDIHYQVLAVVRDEAVALLKRGAATIRREFPDYVRAEPNLGRTHYCLEIRLRMARPYTEPKGKRPAAHRTKLSLYVRDDRLECHSGSGGLGGRSASVPLYDPTIDLAEWVVREALWIVRRAQRAVVELQELQEYRAEAAANNMSKIACNITVSTFTVGKSLNTMKEVAKYLLEFKGSPLVGNAHCYLIGGNEHDEWGGNGGRNWEMWVLGSGNHFVVIVPDTLDYYQEFNSAMRAAGGTVSEYY